MLPISSHGILPLAIGNMYNYYYLSDTILIISITAEVRIAKFYVLK